MTHVRSLLTLARLRIDGIIWGSPYIELTDSNAIQSSTGYSAVVSASVLIPQQPRCAAGPVTRVQGLLNRLRSLTPAH
jgi:hypothetical protein